ncbi:MAG: pyruvate, phosphate dikinase, partial [Thermoplasmata archaeon]
RFLEKMKRILYILEAKIGTPVDVEFASDGEHLYFLQCRPQSQGRGITRKQIPKNININRKIFSANKYVTTSQLENIEYLVYVVPEEYSALKSREEMQKVASIVNKLNQKLPKRKFILMGPGRWGSRGDVKLGVPVNYGNINNTALLVEIAKTKGEYTPELSFGTHFFQDLVEADIKYLPLYPDDAKTIFNESILLNTKNYLEKILPKNKNYQNVIKLIKSSDLLEGGTLSIIMDGDANEALAFLSPPDHWNWRLQKVEELAEEIDPELYGIETLYLIGSTKSGTAGPSSDIDLIVHFKGTKDQKEQLIEWFEEQSKKLGKENQKRTGVQIDDLLDVHFITDEDIQKNTSWATHITSPYMNVRKIMLKQKADGD